MAKIGETVGVADHALSNQLAKVHSVIEVKWRRHVHWSNRYARCCFTIQISAENEERKSEVRSNSFEIQSAYSRIRVACHRPANHAVCEDLVSHLQWNAFAELVCSNIIVPVSNTDELWWAIMQTVNEKRIVNTCSNVCEKEIKIVNSPLDCHWHPYTAYTVGCPCKDQRYQGCMECSKMRKL